MNRSDFTDDYYLIQSLKKGNWKIFSFIFAKYYKDMVLYAGVYIKNLTECEDIVQNVFSEMWEKRKNITFELSVKFYLLKSVKNRCLNEIKRCRIHDDYLEKMEMGGTFLENNETEDYILYSDLDGSLRKALEKLSPKEKKMFEMNRMQNMKYREIADTMDVSVRTVEDGISSALKQLRILLKDYLFVFLPWLSCTAGFSYLLLACYLHF